MGCPRCPSLFAFAQRWLDGFLIKGRRQQQVVVSTGGKVAFKGFCYDNLAAIRDNKGFQDMSVDARGEEPGGGSSEGHAESTANESGQFEYFRHFGEFQVLRLGPGHRARFFVGFLLFFGVS